MEIGMQVGVKLMMEMMGNMEKKVEVIEKSEDAML